MAVCAHGQCGAEGVLHAGGADGDGDDLSLYATLAEAQSLFDTVLVHCVHDEFAIFESNRIVCDMYALFGVEDLAKEGQYAHVFTTSFLCIEWFDSLKLPGVVEGCRTLSDRGFAVRL